MDRRLAAFRVTAELGSVSRAAASLAMTQSALSKLLRRLEADFGVPLFERHPRGVRLSTAGNVLLRRTERAALELQHAREEIAALKPSLPTSLRIAAGPIYLLDWLRYPIKEIARRYPEMSFEITSSGSAAALTRLLKGELDAFLGYVEPDAITENLDCLTIDKVGTRAFGPQAVRGGISAANAALIVRQPWVNYSEATRTNERLRLYWVRTFGIEPTIRFTASSMRTALALAADNGCWICLPAPLADVAAEYGLRQIESKRSFWTFNTGCVVRRSSLGYSTIREFMDIIRAHVA